MSRKPAAGRASPVGLTLVDRADDSWQHPIRRRARGTGSVYYHAAVGQWAAQRPRSLDPKRRISYHRTEAEAHETLDAELSQAGAVARADPMAEPFGAFLVRWIAAQEQRGLAERSLALYRYYATFVGREIGRVAVAELAPYHVNDIVARMSASGLSSSYIDQVVSVLGRAIRDCYRWAGVTRANPVDGAVSIRVVRPERQCWSEAEARRFLEAARSDELEAAWRLALDVGLRNGEIRGLLWEHYDPDRRTLRIVEQSDRRRVRGPTKSRRSRSVRLTPATCQALDRQRARLQELATGGSKRSKRARLAGTGPLDPIFPGRLDARGCSQNKLRDHFLGLVEISGVKRITIHDLRHTAASIMLRRGLALPLVSKILGHASPAITARVYSHVIDEMETSAADVMAGVFPADPEPEA